MEIEEFTKTGAYHRRESGENEDCLSHNQNENFCVISLADGVSSCKRSKEGAEIASRVTTNTLLENGEDFFKYGTRDVANILLTRILLALKRRARMDVEDIDEYSSTIGSVLYDKKRKKILCCNLGDGIIIAAGKGRCQVIIYPSDSLSGCYVTTTRGVACEMSVKMVDADETEFIMICSDGAWRGLFCGSKLGEDISGMFLNKEYDKMKEYLWKQNNFDDSSFILMDLRKENYRM